MATKPTPLACALSMMLRAVSTASFETTSRDRTKNSAEPGRVFLSNLEWFRDRLKKTRVLHEDALNILAVSKPGGRVVIGAPVRRATVEQAENAIAGFTVLNDVTITQASAVWELHATDPGTVHMAAWARVDGLSVADVDKALYVDRTLVKHLCMRRTLFVFRRELLGTVVSAASQRVADQERRRLAKEVERAGLFDDGAAWLAQAEAAALAALDRLGEATSTELRAEVPLLVGSMAYAPDKPYGGKVSVGPRVLTCLSAAGDILRASNRGGWAVSRPAWARTTTWLGGKPELPPEREARAELVRRWLARFGPATPADVKWWLGSTVTAVRQALADVGAVEVDLHGRAGVALPDDLDPVPAPEPWAALLPGLDPTTMGWYERDWYLGPHRAAVFDSNGNGGTTAWWDGRIVGGWAHRLHRLHPLAATPPYAPVRTRDTEATETSARSATSRMVAAFMPRYPRRFSESHQAPKSLSLTGSRSRPASNRRIWPRRCCPCSTRWCSRARSSPRSSPRSPPSSRARSRTRRRR